MKNGKTTATFKHDYKNAITNELSNSYVQQFNSTHAIASGNNVYEALSLRHLSD